MKGLPLLQAIASVLIVLVVAGFGAYAVIMSIATVRSKINFVLIDTTNINLHITANAEWVEPSDQNFQFITETQTVGFTKTSWSMPDINFSNEEPIMNNAVLRMLIVNRNQAGGNGVKIILSNIAYDVAKSDPVNYRFRSKVSTSQDDFYTKQEIMVNQVTKEYTLPASQAIIIKIEYSLAITNSIFSIDQNINIAFESIIE